MRQRAILHIEDNPSLANVVKLSFESFGFEGEMLHAALVQDALDLLKERELKGLSLDLIISDMELPDGQGVDVLQYIKSNPAWHKTPVVILSGDCTPGTISEAYALGANCYLSKFPMRGKAIDNFRSIYHFWLEKALLPESSFVNGIQKVLNTAVRLRARTSQLYVRLSKESATDAELESFWLERALVEGNLSSLISFFFAYIDDDKISAELTERLSIMQVNVEAALVKAEHIVGTLSQHEKNDIHCALLGLVEAWDEELLAEVHKVSFPLKPSISESITTRCASQINELAAYVKNKSDDHKMLLRAEGLYIFSQRLSGLLSGAQH